MPDTTPYVGVVVVTHGQLASELLNAAEGCPTEAILLYDADGKQLYPDR